METLPSRYKRALARVGKYGKGEVRGEGGEESWEIGDEGVLICMRHRQKPTLDVFALTVGSEFPCWRRLNKLNFDF